jgi:hypothetical protein
MRGSAGALQLHHCCSHGTPSPLPSILVRGQCSTKKVASAQDVICEQWVRPSHLNGDGSSPEGAGAATRMGATASGDCDVPSRWKKKAPMASSATTTSANAGGRGRLDRRTGSRCRRTGSVEGAGREDRTSCMPSRCTSKARILSSLPGLTWKSSRHPTRGAPPMRAKSDACTNTSARPSSGVMKPKPRSAFQRQSVPSNRVATALAT